LSQEFRGKCRGPLNESFSMSAFKLSTNYTNKIEILISIFIISRL